MPGTSDLLHSNIIYHSNRQQLQTRHWFAARHLCSTALVLYLTVCFYQLQSSGIATTDVLVLIFKSLWNQRQIKCTSTVVLQNDYNDLRVCVTVHTGTWRLNDGGVVWFSNLRFSTNPIIIFLVGKQNPPPPKKARNRKNNNLDRKYGGSSTFEPSSGKK